MLGILIGSRDIKTKAVLAHVKFTAYCGRSSVAIIQHDFKVREEQRTGTDLRIQRGS